MEIKEILSDITAELARTFDALDEGELAELERRVLAADRVFVAAAGRSLLAIRGFAMRLMHFGFTAYVVGETVTPATAEANGLDRRACTRCDAEQTQRLTIGSNRDRGIQFIGAERIIDNGFNAVTVF